MRHLTVILLTGLALLGLPQANAQSDLPPPIIGIHDVVSYYIGPSVKGVIEVEEEGEDLVIVSNNCGFETSHIIGFELETGHPSRVIANQHMGEWCRARFISQGNRYMLVFPNKKFESEFIRDERFEYGYQIDTLSVYEYDGEYYLDIGTLFEKNDGEWTFSDEPRFQNYKDRLTYFPIDDFIINYNVTEEDFVEIYNPQIYTLSEDGDVNLRRAIPLSSLYPQAIRALIKSNY